MSVVKTVLSLKVRAAEGSKRVVMALVPLPLRQWKEVVGLVVAEKRRGQGARELVSAWMARLGVLQTISQAERAILVRLSRAKRL